MSLLASKGAPSVRIVALPLARVKVSGNVKRKEAMVVFYHFDLGQHSGNREDLPWHKSVLQNMIKKAAVTWNSLGRAPKGSWKLWTHELGERMADRIDFEEFVLGEVDPSLGPTIPRAGANKRVCEVRNNTDRPQSLPKAYLPQISLVYPPSLYPTCGEDRTLHSPVVHLKTLLASRTPRHRRGFYLWMLVAPVTFPITLIPIIPNFPLFFCIWRSWSHYRAYKSSQYLSSLLIHGLIGENPSTDLDKLYASSTLSSRRTCSHLSSSVLTSKPSEHKATGKVVDRESEAASGNDASRSVCILLTREAMLRVFDMFHLPESSTLNMHRAMHQARGRLRKSAGI